MKGRPDSVIKGGKRSQQREPRDDSDSNQPPNWAQEDSRYLEAEHFKSTFFT